MIGWVVGSALTLTLSCWGASSCAEKVVVRGQRCSDFTSILGKNPETLVF